jgi:hypothetical protein
MSECLMTVAQFKQRYEGAVAASFKEMGCPTDQAVSNARAMLEAHGSKNGFADLSADTTIKADPEAAAAYAFTLWRQWEGLSGAGRA